MSTENDAPQPADPSPQWDADRQQWVANGYRWDDAAQQWLPLEQPSASAPAAPVTPSEPAAAPAAEAANAAAGGAHAAAASSTANATAPSPATPQPGPQPAVATPNAWGPQPVGSAPSAPAAPHGWGPAAPGAPQGWGPSQPPSALGLAPDGQKKGLGTGAIIGIVVGGVAVLAIIGVIAALLIAPKGQDAAARASSVVTTYLNALAGSDAETALAQLDSIPGDKSLLTDDVLKASNDLAPLTNVTVTTPSGVSDRDYSIDVPVSYSIGDTVVDTVFTVSDYSGKGDFTIQPGTLELSVPTAVRGLDVTINGATVDSDSVTVFPGTYEVETSTPNYALSGGTTVTLADPNDYAGRFDDVTAALTDQGVEAFRTAVTNAVNACVASTTLTAGCGIDIPATLSDGTKIIDGTIKRTLSADAQAKLASLAPDDIYSNPLQVRGPYIGSLDVTADCESGGRRLTGCTFLFLPSLGSPLVDFSTEPATVRWD